MVPGVSEPVGWVGRRVLITGAAGFIGQRLVRRLVGAGARVYAGLAPDEAPERAARLPAQVHRLTFDLRDAAAVRSAVAEAMLPRHPCPPAGEQSGAVVFHLAAVGVTDRAVDPALALAVNGGGTVHLLEALRDRDVRRVVLTGTCYEYGAREAVEGLDPFNAYAASKVAAWAFGRMYWRVHGLPVVTVRPFQIYGPGQPGHTLIPAAIRAALAGEDFPMTPGEQERDFIYVDDVVEGMVAAGASDVEGLSLDLGTGVARPVRQVVEQAWKLAGGSGRVLAGALPYRPGEVMRLMADAERTEGLIGWRARVGLEEGLRRTVDNEQWSMTNEWSSYD
jgi:UDP-glucose 4-epimerase